MKLAVAGKGGSGKTSISGTMARLWSRSGLEVLAIDGDSNPNLALTLGVEDMNAPVALARDLIERREGGTAVLTRPLEQICREHSYAGADGVTLLVMAHPEHAGTGCLCGMHATVRTMLEVADEDYDVTVLDTEASPEHLSRGTARHADMLVTVVEPYFKSLETARRMTALARELGVPRIELVANKIRDARDREAVQEFAAMHELAIAGFVPFDAALPEAERAGVAPLDHAPDSPAIHAIAAVAQGLLAR